jgi:ATP-dependent helicase HrpA
LARLVGGILADYQAVLKKLQTTRGFPQVMRDVELQLGRLLHKHVIVATPWERLQHFPRYLKAVGVRLDKLRDDPSRDVRAMAELAPFEMQWQREQARQAKSGMADVQLDQYRWLLEEFRVQLFAQELKTAVPVSAKRLQKTWAAIRR